MTIGLENIKAALSATIGVVCMDWQICEDLMNAHKAAHPNHIAAIDSAFPMMKRPPGINGEWAYRKFVSEQLNRVIDGEDLSQPTDVEIFNAICSASQMAPIHGIQMLTALYLCARTVFDADNPFERDILDRLEQDASAGQIEFGEKIIKEVSQKLKYRAAVNYTAENRFGTEQNATTKPETTIQQTLF